MQLVAHVGVALVSGLFDDLGDFLGDLGVRIDFVNVDGSLAIEAASGGDASGVF